MKSVDLRDWKLDRSFLGLDNSYSFRVFLEEDYNSWPTMIIEEKKNGWFKL